MEAAHKFDFSNIWINNAVSGSEVGRKRKTSGGVSPPSASACGSGYSVSEKWCLSAIVTDVRALRDPSFSSSAFLLVKKFVPLLLWARGVTWWATIFSYRYSGEGHPWATHSSTAPSSWETATCDVCSTTLGETIPRWSGVEETVTKKAFKARYKRARMIGLVVVVKQKTMLQRDEVTVIKHLGNVSSRNAFPAFFHVLCEQFLIVFGNYTS